MRTQFIECITRYAARKTCPWAAVIVQVDGGYMAFESIDDYRTWRDAK